MNYWITYICILIFGVTTFLNRLSLEKMSPFMIQIVVGFSYVLYLPFALYYFGINNIKWCYSGLLLTFIASFLSIFATLLLNYSLQNNQNSGSQTMMISLFPVVSLFLSIIFLDEKLTYNKIIGVILMITGTVFLQFK